MRTPEVTPAKLVEALRRTRRALDAFRGKPVPGENVFEFRAPETTIQFHGQGLGDMMIIRQFGRAFAEHVRDVGDPALGDVVIAGGAYKAAYRPEPGDVNCYWWWSFGPKDDEPGEFLEFYVEEATVAPDVVLCLSERCRREADQLGFDTLYLPLGTQSFEPLDVPRRGLGYAGSRAHKEERKFQRVVGHYADRPDFEFVSHFVTPTQLNLWYNTRLATFGMTLEGQRRWGMVNNRVFETLASGTPLILEEHPTVEDVLGFEFPYQSAGRRETVELMEEIEADPGAAADTFSEYARRVRDEHSYANRVETLLDALS